MPPVPAALFAEALSSLSVSLAGAIPGGRGQSLYLRPTMFGLDRSDAINIANGQDDLFLGLGIDRLARHDHLVAIDLEINARGVEAKILELGFQHLFFRRFTRLGLATEQALARILDEIPQTHDWFLSQ